MCKSSLIPQTMEMFLWKAVCSETGLYRLGRGQQKRSERNLAGALLHLDGGKERKLLPIRIHCKTLSQGIPYLHQFRNSVLKFSIGA